MAQIEMDNIRDVAWNFTAIKNFEQRAKAILSRLHVTIPNILLIDGKPVEVGTVPVANATALKLLASFGKMAEILEVAVGASTGLSWLEAKGQPSEAAVAIDGWMARGNRLDSLAELVYGEFLRASDPLAFKQREEALAKRNAEANPPSPEQ